MARMGRGRIILSVFAAWPADLSRPRGVRKGRLGFGKAWHGMGFTGTGPFVLMPKGAGPFALLPQGTGPFVLIPTGTVSFVLTAKGTRLLSWAPKRSRTVCQFVVLGKQQCNKMSSTVDHKCKRSRTVWQPEGLLESVSALCLICCPAAGEKTGSGFKAQGFRT